MYVFKKTENIRNLPRKEIIENKLLLLFAELAIIFHKINGFLKQELHYLFLNKVFMVPCSVSTCLTPLSPCSSAQTRRKETQPLLTVRCYSVILCEDFLFRSLVIKCWY